MIRNVTTILIVALVVGGALVRLAERDQTFFGDEMWVLEFVGKGLYVPHAVPQPPLFFYSAVAASGVCGMGESCLRAPAEIAAVLLTLIPLLVWRTTRVLQPAGAIVWTVLLAFSSPLSFYAARAKQYSLEALGCAVILWLFVRALEEPRRWRTFAIVSAFLVATLHSPVFVLAATGIAGLLLQDRKRLLAIHAALAAVFAAAYFGYMRPGAEVARYFGDLEEYFTADLPAFWDGSIGFLWSQTRLWVAQMLNLTRGLAFCLALGIAAWLWRKRDATLAIITLAPIALVLLASALRLYPYGEVRLMIFLLPGLSLAFALAVQTFDRIPVAAVVAVLLIVFVVRGVRDDPYNSTYMHVDDLRRSYEWLQARRQPGTPVVVREFDVRPLRHYVGMPVADVVAVPPGAAQVTVNASEYWTFLRDHDAVRVTPPAGRVEEVREGRMRLSRWRGS
ncbi:MAG TPA: hypothetical protein VFV49_17345, partial [Thermoanaerobaculia bacterium]|nr:hypothetical protein [Thermoanaerobaculia bacterium]